MGYRDLALAMDHVWRISKMKITKMPGFTAEASVYQTGGHYQFGTGEAPVSRGVVPQLKRNDLPGASCGKDPVFGNVICVECTTGPFPTSKTYVCDKDGNNCKQTVRLNTVLAGSIGGIRTTFSRL